MATTTDPLSALRSTDPQLAAMLDREAERQDSTLEFIASENHTSKAVMEATGSWLTNKYAEGYPGKRYYGGCEFHDQIEDLARDRAKELFAVNLPTCNLTAEQMQTLPLLWHCFNQATEF